MNPASRWVCLAVRVFFGVSLALSSTATQQAAHGLGGAGRLVVESSSEGADSGEIIVGAAATGSGRRSAESAQHRAEADVPGVEGLKRITLREDIALQGTVAVRSFDAARLKGEKQMRTPSGSPPSTTQHPEDEAFPTIASSRALVETAAAGKAAPLAAAPAALPASLSPTAALEGKPFGSRVLTTTTAPPSTMAESASPTPAPAAILEEVVRVGRSGTVVAGTVAIFSVAGIVLVSVGSLMMSRQGSGSRKSPNIARDDMEMGGASTPVGGTLDEQAQQHERKRRPAVTLCFLLVAQLQFLATLSLVKYTVAVEGSLLADFVSGLRWVNLWWTADFAEDFGWGGCVLSAGQGDLGASVFVGNLALVVVALVGIFLLHVAVISGVEALWLAKKHAAATLAAASSRPAPRREIPSVRFASERKFRRSAPGDPSHRASVADSDRNKSANDEDLPTVQEESECSDSSRSNDEEQLGSDHSEGEGKEEVTADNEHRLGPVETCREQSRSAWIHFPHVELVFLLFAFEGAVASQASAIRSSSCPEISATAGVMLLLYPVLMVLVVWRVIAVRVHPHVLLAFKRFGDAEAKVAALHGSSIGCTSKLKSDWTEGRGLFSWGDKGRWETNEKEHQAESREHDWFRVGFEPVFVDYTKRGVWFVMVSLVERAVVACIGVLVDGSTVQLLLFCVVKIVVFFIVVCLKPFANRIVNTMSASVAAMNAISAGILALSARRWGGDDRVRAIDTTVVVLQLVLLCGLLVPMYLDSIMVLVGTACKNRRKTPSKEHAQDRAAGGVVRNYTRRQWCRAWCDMIRHNIVACARDTREGLRRPYDPSPRTGPHPGRDPQKSTPTAAVDRPRRLGGGSDIGMVNSPVTMFLGGGKLAASGMIDGASPVDRTSKLQGAPSGRMVIQRGASGCGSDVTVVASFQRLAVPTDEGRNALEGDDSWRDQSSERSMPPTAGSMNNKVGRKPRADRPGSSFFADNPRFGSSAETCIPHHSLDDSLVSSKSVDSTTHGRSILARGPSVGSVESPAEEDRESLNAAAPLTPSHSERRQSSERSLPSPSALRGGARDARESDPDGGPGQYSTETAGPCPAEPHSPRPPSVAPTSSAGGSSPSVSIQGGLGGGTGGESVEPGAAVRGVHAGVKYYHRPGMRFFPRVSWGSRKDSTKASRARRRPRGVVGDVGAGALAPPKHPESSRRDGTDVDLGPAGVMAARDAERQGTRSQVHAFARNHNTAPWDSAAGSAHFSRKLLLCEPGMVVDDESGHTGAVAYDDDGSKDDHEGASKSPPQHGGDGEAAANGANGADSGGNRRKPESSGSTSFLAGLGVGRREPIQSHLPRRRSEMMSINKAALPVEVPSPGTTRRGTVSGVGVGGDEDVLSRTTVPADDGENGSDAKGQEADPLGPANGAPPPAAIEVSNRYANYTFAATPPPVGGGEGAGGRPRQQHGCAWMDGSIED